MKTFLLIAATVFFTTSGFGQSLAAAPKAVNNPDPEYPAEAASLGYGGTIVVNAKINKRGQVSVTNAFGPAAPCTKLNDPRTEKIRKAVVEAAKQVQFEPPMKDGKPTEIEMYITYRFDKEGKPLHQRLPSEGLVKGGVLQGRVRYLAKPEYPSSAKAIRLSGAVPVDVLVDTDGKVIAAAALGGHAYLQHNAVVAACRSSMEPVSLSGVPVQVSGVITFSFLP